MLFDLAKCDQVAMATVQLAPMQVSLFKSNRL